MNNRQRALGHSGIEYQADPETIKRIRRVPPVAVAAFGFLSACWLGAFVTIGMCASRTKTISATLADLPAPPSVVLKPDLARFEGKDGQIRIIRANGPRVEANFFN